MKKTKARKSKAVKSVKDLHAKTLKAKAGKGVRGGFRSVEHGTSAPAPHRRTDGTGGGNVSGGWDLIGNKVNA